jgi:hypothetical protein
MLQCFSGARSEEDDFSASSQTILDGRDLLFDLLGGSIRRNASLDFNQQATTPVMDKQISLTACGTAPFLVTEYQILGNTLFWNTMIDQPVKRQLFKPDA